MTTTENRERFELWATVRKDARRVIEREALQHGYASALAWAAYDAATKSFDAAAAHQVCDYMAEGYADAMAEDDAAAFAGNREPVAFDKHGKAVAWRIDPDEESEPAAYSATPGNRLEVPYTTDEPATPDVP